jgi:glycosyltransferase involved in cell wall biosynthesis
MSAPLPLSISIISLNEQDNLPRCLASVQGLASEIVVLDSGSTDQTAAIAAQFGARFQFQRWQGHVAQKNAALSLCTQPWVLCLDADEALTPELAESIRHAFAGGEPKAAGFELNRRTFYLGDWLWHVWYPQWRLRLVRRESASWQGRDPHDRLEVNGAVERLRGDMLHYTYRDLTDHFHRMVKYAHTLGQSMFEDGRRARWHHFLITPWLNFFKYLVLKQAWRDGWRGWIVAFMHMVSVFAKYAFLYEKGRAAARRRNP